MIDVFLVRRSLRPRRSPGRHHSPRQPAARSVL